MSTFPLIIYRYSAAEEWTYSVGVSWYIGPRSGTRYKWTEPCFQFRTGIDRRADGTLYSSFLFLPPPYFLIPASSVPCALALYPNRPICSNNMREDTDGIERIDLVNVAFWYVPSLPIPIHFHSDRTRTRSKMLLKQDQEGNGRLEARADPQIGQNLVNLPLHRIWGFYMLVGSCRMILLFHVRHLLHPSWFDPTSSCILPGFITWDSLITASRGDEVWKEREADTGSWKRREEYPDE